MMLPSVCRYVFAMGISPRHKGFVYICELISALLCSGWPENNGGVEAAMGAICDSRGTDRRTAERCMRYAVQYAWNSDQGAIRQLFGGRPGQSSAAGPGFRCAAPPALLDFIFAAALELWESGAAPEGEAVSGSCAERERM